MSDIDKILNIALVSWFINLIIFIVTVCLSDAELKSFYIGSGAVQLGLSAVLVMIISERKLKEGG